ncbi:queuosine precursor transporter [Elioraea sp.]|uniref:queuosine precursor transporter n=1 Tax=Elioraea sp. TaxID=2185103 RepID=UPI0025C2327C|nr:queuosine precursor transporter [Elioraea sp.]
MLPLSPAAIVAALNALPPDVVWLMMAAASFGAVLAMLAAFGRTGLVVFIAVAVIAANLQVLKVVPFVLLPGPVAEGTVVFAATYLATDILAEHYGPAAARQAVWLGFAAHLIMTVLMLLALGYRPLDAATAGEGLAWALPFHDHLAALFTPAPALFVAGMTSYLVSQLIDIRIFTALGIATAGRALWLRNTASTAVSALIDSVLFSTLAFVVFAENPVPWDVLWRTYILGTWLVRLGLAVADTPAMYLAGRLVPEKR